MNTKEILETINMIDNEDLDVRTITMGISLLDCIHPDGEKAAQAIYDKICRYAERLVQTGEDISRQYGIPIINKRISVTPIAISLSLSKQLLAFLSVYDFPAVAPLFSLPCQLASFQGTIE